MKNTLNSIIENDKSYNKSATRYLYKTHPVLWSEVLEKTNFLPLSAKPKQRIWHIINDVYIRPICPITNEYLKWHENRYFIAANASARTTILNIQGKLNNRSAETNEKRKLSNIEAVKRGRKYKKFVSEDQKIKTKKTFIRKYGVDNPSKHPSIRKKISDAAVKNGATPKNLRNLRDIYYVEVRRITKENWIQHFDKINPLRLRRGDYHLDHIFSQQEGFRNNIPPYVIGHWTNLRLITPAENNVKGMKCSKSKDKLFEDFFSSL